MVLEPGEISCSVDPTLNLERPCCKGKPLIVCRVGATLTGILTVLTILVIGVFLIRKGNQNSKINNIVYVTQALILSSYLCKYIHFYHLARFIYFMDMTFWKLNVCAFNLFEFLPTIFTSMAYFTYLGNWLSLTLALSIASQRRKNWKHAFLKWFRPGLYIFVGVYFVFIVTFILSNCH
jgi:hypothetical protein